jgi:Ca2+-binding EF-hand superfamily protein
LQLSRYEFSRALTSINIALGDDDLDVLLKKYDDSGNGRVSYAEFAQHMGPFLEATPENAARLMLSADEVKGALGEEAGARLAAAAAAQPAAASASSAARPSSSAGGPRLQRAPSIATADMDLSNTENKMRRVLGRSWVNVYKDVKKSSGTTAVSGETFRDVMAEKGVPLTSKEVRAIALRYGAGSGEVDVEKVMNGTFKSGPSSPTKAARPSTAVPRPGAGGAGRPPMGGTARPQSAAAVRSPGGMSSASSKMLF